MSQPDSGFSLPDWQAPLDAQAQIARCPEVGVVKGLFFQDIVDACAKAGVKPPDTRNRYVPFIDYPAREYMSLLVAAAGIVHPRESIRNGLRRLGRSSYPALADTLIGKAIFGVAGNDFGTILSLASRAYSISTKPGEVTLVERTGRRAVVQLREIWAFPDSHQVGVFEGALIAVGRRGEVKVRAVSPCDADFEVTWD